VSGFPRRAGPEHALALLRVALGIVLIVGGVKLAFAPDPAALAAAYADPASGWVAPAVATQLDAWGVALGSLLQAQGFVEIAMGAALAVGMFVPLTATLSGLMFGAFAAVNPVLGMIRLSRDLGLMGLCFALAAAGAGAASLDRLMWRRRSRLGQRRHGALLAVRLSLAYPLLASGVFTDGLLANPLNASLPLQLLLGLGALLALGAGARVAAAVLVGCVLWTVADAFLSRPFFAALDAVKRELGLGGGAAFYAVLGPDRFRMGPALWARGWRNAALLASGAAHNLRGYLRRR